jgi:hypothetical protein
MERAFLVTVQMVHLATPFWLCKLAPESFSLLLQFVRPMLTANKIFFAKLAELFVL